MVTSPFLLTTFPAAHRETPCPKKEAESNRYLRWSVITSRRGGVAFKAFRHGGIRSAAQCVETVPDPLEQSRVISGGRARGYVQSVITAAAALASRELPHGLSPLSPVFFFGPEIGAKLGGTSRHAR